MTNRNGMVRIVHPHIRGFVNQTETWLARKSAQGLRLETNKGWTFSFRRCRPYQARYFMYSAFNSSREIHFDYHMAKIKYAKADSPLNHSSDEIFEMDPLKVDEEFISYKRHRNHFYKRHYVMLLLISIALIILPLCIIRNRFVWCIIPVPIMMFLYSVVSCIGLWLARE